MVLSITFDAVSQPSEPMQHGFDLELRVEARLRLFDEAGKFFEEPLFSIVELRSALKNWLSSGADAGFEFVSVEADEDPLIYFRPISGGWEIGSSWSERPGRAARAELIAASSAFFTDVDRWVSDNLGISDADAFLRN